MIAIGAQMNRIRRSVDFEIGDVDENICSLNG